MLHLNVLDQNLVTCFQKTTIVPKLFSELIEKQPFLLNSLLAVSVPTCTTKMEVFPYHRVPGRFNSYAFIYLEKPKRCVLNLKTEILHDFRVSLLG